MYVIELDPEGIDDVGDLDRVIDCRKVLLDELLDQVPFASEFDVSGDGIQKW